MAKKLSGNTSGWFKASKEKNIDLSFLHQDKTSIHETLKKLKLPGLAVYYIEDPNSKKVDELYSKSNFFCRLVPHDPKGERPYATILYNAKEFRDFCSKYNLTQYTIMLEEKGNVTHAGAIIACKDHCTIELIEGIDDDLNHGRKNPVNAEVNRCGAITYKTKSTIEERKLVYNALRYIGGPKKTIPGYFEFQVWDRKDIRFRNYQKPDSAFASTPLL